MKKNILLFLCLIVSTQMFAYKMWSEQGYEYPKGYTFADIMKADPEMTWSDIRLSKSIVTLDEKSVELSFDINLSWHNFNRKKWIDWLFKYSAYRTITSFKYSLWVSVGGVVTQLANEEVLDVSNISTDAPEAEYGEEFITTSSTTHSGSFTIDLTKYTSYIIPVDYVEFHITPFGLKEGGENNDELETHREKQIYKIEVNQSGQALKITKANTSSPIINAVGTMNPQYDASGTGSARYLVYNNPNATIAVSLSSANCPVSRNSKILYTANLGSVGAASTPVPVTYKMGNLTNDGSCCSSSCAVGKDKHIQLVGDNAKHYDFLLKKLPVKNYCIANRSRHQLLASTDTAVTTFEKFLQFSEDLDSISTTLKTWIYHLRDFNEVAYNNEKLDVGTVLRIRNSAFYAPKNVFNTYPEYTLMGYTTYGPPFAKYLTTNKDTDYLKSYNTLDYQIIPEASIPNLPDDLTTKKFVCVSSDIDDINDVLILKGNQIECSGYSTTLYSPDYRWEVSVDGGAHWNVMTDKEYSRYFLSYDMLSFPTNTNEDTDLILRSSILSLGKELRFRQSCILKAFSSTVPNSLYTHYENGLYYIKLTAENFYTFGYYSKLQEENFAFTPSDFPQVQNICTGEMPINNIAFEFVSSNAINAQMYDAMKDIVNYQVVRVVGEEEKIVSNLPEYKLNYTGDSLHYICRIIACKDTISKDVWVLPIQKDTINLENISSSGQIRNFDKENNIVQIMVEKGKDIEITINDERLNETDFFIREVKEYNTPNLSKLDFSTMNWQDMVDYAELNCDYDGCLSNYRIFGEDQLRPICETIQTTKNNKLIEEARNEYVEANAWNSFTKENTTIFKTKSDTLTSDIFYIKKQNKTFGCFSDSVRVNIYYFEGIKNNIISFSAAEDADKDMIYVPSGSKNPTISGMLVEGGYGDPDTLSSISTSYEYQYISRSVGGVWQTLSTAFVDYGQHVTPSKTNLAAGRTTIDRNLEIARVVYSRLNNNIYTQVTDTSNILKIYVEYPITEQEVKIKRNNLCPGTEIKVLIADNFSNTEQQHIEYFWSVSDADIKLTYSDIGNRICYINGATEDFVLSVYRYNKRLDSYTESYTVDVPISEVEAKFNIITSDGNELNIFKDTTQKVEFNPGDKIYLINKSIGAKSYLWTLQLQYFLGYEVEGTQTSVENPSCYLYNGGINKLRLTAKNEDGCSHTISAGNLYVNNVVASSERRHSAFFTEEEEPPFITPSQEFTSAYPTLLTDEVEYLNVKSNDERVFYSIYDTNGNTILKGENSSSFRIKLPYMPKGIYVLKLNGKYIKLIRL
jgi:hypothetical protein